MKKKGTCDVNVMCFPFVSQLCGGIISLVLRRKINQDPLSTLRITMYKFIDFVDACGCCVKCCFIDGLGFGMFKN